MQSDCFTPVYIDNAMATFDVTKLRQDFPILQTTVHGKPLIYLDNAATSQKPHTVIQTLVEYYQQYNANVHRGLHYLSEQATIAYEQVREKVMHFIHAADSREIVFVRGTTEAINLVAHSFAKPRLQPGDEIVITEMEHHSNIVPWEMVCQQTGALLRRIPVTEAGELNTGQFDQCLTKCTKLVALTHVSNVLGTVNPIQLITQMAHAQGVPVLVDGAQAPAHLFEVDVRELDCDFYTLSSHKMFGPTGVGVLYAKSKWLEQMLPYQGGGEMVERVSLSMPTTYKEIPYRFEAGTPNIAGTIGLGAAIDYLAKLDKAAARNHERFLCEYLLQQLATLPNIRILGAAKQRASIATFVFSDMHAQDVATMLDQFGIAVRSGHHCAMPLMERYRLSATLRASLAFYNTKEEVDALIEGLFQVRKWLA